MGGVTAGRGSVTAMRPHRLEETPGEPTGPVHGDDAPVVGEHLNDPQAPAGLAPPGLADPGVVLGPLVQDADHDRPVRQHLQRDRELSPGLTAPGVQDRVGGKLSTQVTALSVWFPGLLRTRRVAARAADTDSGPAGRTNPA